MVDERYLRAALNAEASTVELPDNLWPEILHKARRKGAGGWWGRLAPLTRVGLALLVMTMLMGAAGYLIVPPVETPAPRLDTEIAAVEQISAQLGFKVQLPGYLPTAVELHESRIESYGTDPSAKKRVAALYFMTPDGASGIAIKQWRAGVADSFVPGDPHAAAFRLDGRQDVQVKGHQATLLTGKLSGQTINLIYWQEGGINYSVSGRISSGQLLRVAESIR